ncbi:MAG: hypothetical protein KW802_04510 [Candidatus Doudnabacteria bacterium]|nr:hypothetical protein [Candidatus Doudnabacteria bacterium]
MFKNRKQKNITGSFQVKAQHKFFQKKTLLLALLIFILGTSAYYGIRQKTHKEAVSGTATEISASDIPGWWLQKYFGASVCTQDICKPESDPDQDKLTNTQEFYYHSSPVDQDTNKNGMKDGEDVANNYDPSQPGKVSFDDIATDESILGESLVFDSDVKQLINQMTDPTKIKLPEVKSEEIIISKDDSKQAREEYLNKLSQAVEKYFNFDVEATFKAAAQNGNEEQIQEIKVRSLKLLVELKTIPTPPSTAPLHKYYIALVQLIPKVISMPGADTLGQNEEANNLWYDSAQSYFVLLQKIGIEREKLNQLK